MISSDFERFCVDSVRCLGAALPQAANSGHPGAPMGCAPIAHVLWGKVMRYAPNDSKWIARDRFVMSNGHGCALQYAMLHLTGYQLSLQDLKSFRQLDSKTPGHPEAGVTEGIEVTTGPLGQGIAQAVGIAIAAESMRARFNKPDFELFNNFTYVLLGDGCLQEGVASEACSLAGHLGLGRLIGFYDKNQISIDGDTDLSFTENVSMRFQSYGWETLYVENADTDIDSIHKCVMQAQQSLDKPTLIICKTVIGFGSLKQGSEKVHGSPLGLDDLLAVRKKFGLTAQSAEDIFNVDPEVVKFYSNKGLEGSLQCDEWKKQLVEYGRRFPADLKELTARLSPLPLNEIVAALPKFSPSDKAEATRNLSGTVLNAVANKFSCIVGGSADLTSSNCSGLKNATDFSKTDRIGRYIRFGVREHAMAAICNGIFAHGGFRPFGATFLNFIGYAWGAVRISALSEFGILYIATHDSIELGEDGPTHQPIEMPTICRATPNMIYCRPADGNEVSGAYALWLGSRSTPMVLALCRGAVPQLQGSSIEGTLRGGYILEDFKNDTKPKLILASCGSELSICVEAAAKLRAEFDVRVISMPSWDIFMSQSEDYRKQVIPNGVRSLYVEAASTLGPASLFTKSIGMTTFGTSAPKKAVFNKFGFTSENIAREAKSLF